MYFFNMNGKLFFILLSGGIWLSSCKGSLPLVITEETQEVVDYSAIDNWAAHPDKIDPADRIPSQGVNDRVDHDVDVFFIHPTTYTSYKGDIKWNAILSDQKLNEHTDNTTILYQASCFNAAGRVWAPRYRQAHIESFYTNDRALGNKALLKAYEDVKSAFQYYLKNHNQGRSILIAAHSQGTVHAKNLLHEFFDTDEMMRNRLIAAYLVGMPIKVDEFKHIDPCDNKDDTNCFVSWRTFRKDYVPTHIPHGDTILVTNPLSWNLSSDYQNKEFNQGAILRKFDKVYPELVDATSIDGLLYVTKPKFPWSFLFGTKNYHIADINFFYFNIRENAAHRANTFRSGNLGTSK